MSGGEICNSALESGCEWKKTNPSQSIATGVKKLCRTWLGSGPAHLSRLRSEQGEDVDEDKNKGVDIKDKKYDTEQNRDGEEAQDEGADDE